MSSSSHDLPAITQLVAAKALIKNDQGEILVLKQSSEKEVSNASAYHPPGGIIEDNESIADALAREIKEETGQTLLSHKLFDVGQWQANLRGTACDFFGIFYLCRVNSYNVVLQEEEVADYAWVDLNTIADFEIVEPSRSIIKAALEQESGL